MKYSALPNDDVVRPTAERSFRGFKSFYHVLLLTAAYSLLTGWTTWLYIHFGDLTSSKKANLFSKLHQVFTESSLLNLIHIHLAPMHIPEEYEFVVWDLDTKARNSIYMGGNTPERIDAWHKLSRST